MLKKRVFGMMAVLAAVALVFALVGCGGADGGPAGGGGSGGGDQPGANIATKYRGVYSGQMGPGGLEVMGDFTLSEDKITFVEEHESLVQDLFPGADESTGPDHVVTFVVRIGTWAYLYSGTSKIGIVFHNEQGDEYELATGRHAAEWAEGFNLSFGLQNEHVDMSDMDTNVDISGFIY